MKKLVKYFNNLIEKTIFKVKNKTNIKFQTSNFNMKKLVKNFNNLIEKTIFKVQNKTNTKFQISNFNKYVITFISLLFFYLFYLSVPVLYDKAWVQSNIENQLFKEYKINFSISSEVSYRILPKPHFLIKDSKIFKEEGDKKVSLVDIKNLKVFISQKSFFGKRKINIKNIKIDKANFLLLRGDFKLLKNSSKKKFSKKRIDISNSNIFFKDNSDETLTIIKLSKAFLFQDDENLLNLFNLKGKVFNIPFNFDYKKKFNYPLTEEINIIAKTLKLNIFDIFNNDEDNLNNGSNIISFLNSKIKTDYKIEDDILIFNSSNSKIKNSEIDYKGELSIDPFDLKLDINIIDNQELFRILNINLILIKL